MTDAEKDVAKELEEKEKPEPKAAEETAEEAKNEEEEGPKTPLGDPLATASQWMAAGTSWGASWLSSARQKTFDTLELVKKDLSEFTETVTTEASALTSAAKEASLSGLDAVKAQASALEKGFEKLVSPTDEEAPEDGAKEAEPAKEVPKSGSMGFGWMRQFVDTVKTLGIDDTTANEDEHTDVIRPRLLRNTNLSKMRLMELQSSEATFLEPPEDDAAEYDTFVEKFSLEEHDGEISQLLSTNPPLRALFSSLVPSKVDNATFWMRYFFKVSVAEAREQQKEFRLGELTVKTTYTKEPEGERGAVRRISPESDKNVATKEQPTSPARSADDWSVCSGGEGEIQELDSESPADEDNGPLTPRPIEEKKGKKEGDDWVDWDE